MSTSDIIRTKFHDRIYAKTFLRLVPRSVHPNHVTMARFLLTPGVVMLTVAERYGLALASFLMLAFSDTLDGSLARVRNKVTTWGKVFDPVADKILIGSLVIVLVMQHISAGLALVILGLELSFMVLGFWKLMHGTVVQANRWGKIKMSLQVLGVSLLLIGIMTGFSGLFHVSAQAFYVAIIFAVVSLFAAGI